MKLFALLAGLALASAAPLQANVTTRDHLPKGPIKCPLKFDAVSYRACPHYDKKCAIMGNLMNKPMDTLEVECIARGDSQWCSPFWLKTPDNKFIPDLFFDRVCAAAPPNCPSKYDRKRPPRAIINGKPDIHRSCKTFLDGKRALDESWAHVRPYMEPNSTIPLIP